MELTPVRFLVLFLLLAVLGYIVFTCAARLVAWIVSRMIGGNVRFRIAGINGIKEIAVDFHKGPVTYVTISELKVSVKKPPGSTGWNILSWSSKLLVSVSDVEVVLRKEKGTRQRGKKKYKQNSASRGMWMLAINVAKYLSISVNELVVKALETSFMTLDIKELDVDTFRNDAAIFSLGVKVDIAPIVLYPGEDKRLSDASGFFSSPKKVETDREFYFSLESLALTAIIDHDREAGVVFKQVAVECGDGVFNLIAESTIQELETTSDGDPQDVPETENHKPPEIDTEYEASTLVSKVPEEIKFSLTSFTIEAKSLTGFLLRNDIKKINLHGRRSWPLDTAAVTSLLDIQVDFGEIHLCQFEDKSVLDITTISFSISVQFPLQVNDPLRVEVDVKLEGTKFNLFFSSYEDLMQFGTLHFAKKKKKKKTKNSSGRKLSISWSCSISAPEMLIMFYTLDEKAFMQVFPQTSHIYINIIPTQGTVLHAELGELYVNRIEDARQFPTEFLVGGEEDSGCIIRLSRIAFDNKLDGIVETPVVMVESGTAKVYVGMLNIKAVLFALGLIQSCMKRPKNGTTKESKRRGMVKFQLEQVAFELEENLCVEDSMIPDPKKVNFGSQGGIVMITKQGESLRTARIKPSNETGSSGLKQKLGIILSQMVGSLDQEKKVLLVQLESGQVVYEEVAPDGKKVAERTLLSMHEVQFIHKPVKVADEIVVHFILRAQKVSVHWDPDVHLFFYQLSLGLKELFRDRPTRGQKTSKSKSKSKPCYVLDMQNVKINAELADGVDGTVSVQSLFTEDAVVGVLLEGLEVAFNKAAVARIDRFQVSRIPSVLHDQKTRSLWDILIHGDGVRIIMPYRLPLRGIDDAVEDTWRGLKLAMAAKRKLFHGNKPPELSKLKDRSSSFQVHSIKLHVNGILAEIEEEPLQGWLDEHYRLLREQSRVLLVGEKLLEKLQHHTMQEKRKAWTQLQEQSFQEYRKACAKLIPSRGSGATDTGFQAGFKPSIRRASVMSVSADHVELTMVRMDGGRSGMIEAIRRLDCMKPDVPVPFSRLYGGRVELEMTSLAVCLRDYTPMLSASVVKCEGTAIFAQQATCFQKQVVQRLYIGRWRTVEMLRSMSGTTPSYKFYSELPLELTNAKVCYGVGFEPAFADVSYAFTVALRRTNLGVREPPIHAPAPVKKEKNLPWWDDMRYYIHGYNNMKCSGFEWNFLATADPYETQDRMRMTASTMVINQTDGSLSFHGDNFDMHISSLETLEEQHKFIHAPIFKLDITMDWTCASEDPYNHYLHALPSEQQSREVVYNPFRSLSLSLIWSFSLRTSTMEGDDGVSKSKRNGTGNRVTSPSHSSAEASYIPYMNSCSQDLIWVFKWWNLYFSPPHKLRSFSRWPRFQVERIPRSGNLSLDKVLTEFILRLDSTPALVRHFSRAEDDPAKGLTFRMQKLRYELCYSRGLEKYVFETKRDILDLVYQGLDVHLLRAKLKAQSEAESDIQAGHRDSDRLKDDDFLLSTDCFTLRRQSPKADTSRLSPWRENIHVRSSSHYELSGSENSDATDATFSDPSDDDGLNAVLADNCLRVSLYSLKIFWTVSNRDAVWAWFGDLSKAFEAPKPSPSRQYAQRKLVQEKQNALVPADEGSKLINCTPSQEMLHSKLKENEEEETLQFMVNVIQPQFNLHSEDAHGRFLLAAASGRVLARSFHSTFYVGLEELFQQALGATGSIPELSWKRRELSILLEEVQAHVAPTDVDPGAGIQWLPRIPKGALKVKRTGPLLERVFLPCSMYFQYIRHKGGSTDCKATALKDLSFNSPNITATMTSHQFHIMVDVLSNLLFATLPKPRKLEEEEDMVDATDEVVPDGVEEVDLAKVKLEQVDREMNLLSDDLKVVKRQPRTGGVSPEPGQSPDNALNLFFSSTSTLVRKLEMELVYKKKERKLASASVRSALHRAAQLEREKDKVPSAAMRISLAIDKVVWSMLSDGETFAEAEISSMILNVDRDFSNVGVARFTTKYFVVKNCVRLAKSNVLAAWNPPAEWGRNVMLRVEAKQGPLKEGVSLLELFQVDIYPLRIHLTEVMYTMMWEYFFPGDEQDAQKRQEFWKGTTNSGTRRSRKGVAVFESHTAQVKERTSAPGTPPTLHGQKSGAQVSKTQTKVVSEQQQVAALDEVAEVLSSELVLMNDTDGSKSKRKGRSGKAPQDEKKEAKSRKVLLEIHNIKISQVELLVTYQGSKFSVSELRLLMDTFTRTSFTGSWRRLFSRVKKHIIWGVLKSVTGMQGKKFKDKMQGRVGQQFQDSDSNSSDNGSTSKMRFPIPIPQFSSAGEGFVSSIRGLFNSQKRNMMRTIRGEEIGHEWSDGDSTSRVSARGKTKLLRRHSKKQRSISKGSILLGERYCPSPRAVSSPDRDSSGGSSTYEDFDTS